MNDDDRREAARSVTEPGIQQVRVSASPVTGETRLLLDPAMCWQDAGKIKNALSALGLVVVTDSKRDRRYPY